LCCYVQGTTEHYVCGGLALLNFMGYMCLHRTRQWVMLNTAMEITWLPLVSVPNAEE